MLGQVITIVSGKGGTGKTSTAANLAISLCAYGQKVLLIDADIGLRCLDIVLGMCEDVLFSFGDVLTKRSTLKQAAVTHPIIKNLYLLTAPNSFDEAELYTSNKIKEFLEHAKRHFSHIIVDCAAGINHHNISFCQGSDLCLIVSTLDETSLRGSQKMKSSLFEANCKNVKLIVNRLSKNEINAGVLGNIDHAMDNIGLSLMGFVPEDKNIPICANNDKLLLLDCESHAPLAYNNIAKRLLGEHVPLLKI